MIPVCIRNIHISLGLRPRPAECPITRIPPFSLDEFHLRWVNLILENSWRHRSSKIINRKGGENLDKGFCRVAIVIICIFCLVPIGVSYAQQEKVGGGDIRFEARGSPGVVTFSHETHVKQHNLKCTDCHPKIFKMKRGEAKMMQCTACHDGKRAFSNRDQMLCTNCHK